MPVFRATAVSWVAAKYPAHETELAVSIRANARAVASDAVAVAFAASASASAADVSAAAAFTFASAADVSAADASASALWLEVSADARRVEEEEAAASEIAGSPLWPQGQPDKVRLWQEMKAALLAANQDWEVWTEWYDDRLAGHVRDEERELAYVRIEDSTSCDALFLHEPCFPTGTSASIASTGNRAARRIQVCE